MLTFGSLFSGVGGFDLGLERSGMICKWQCEIDKHARNILSTHWSGMKIYADVKNINQDTKPVGLICGGFPCQDVSVAGKRTGLAGSRSGLWFEFHRILGELRPQWVVIENVPGLLSSNKGKDFAVILQGLGKLGYLPSWRILDSQYFGVAQRRRRLFIVASLGDGRAAEVLFERESMSRNPPSREKAGQVAPTLSSSGAGTSRTGNERTEADFCIPTVAKAVRTPSGGIDREDMHTLVAGSVSCKWAKDTGGPSGDEVQNLVAFSAGNSDKSYGVAADENVTPPIRAGASGTNQAPTIAFTPRASAFRSMSINDICPTLESTNNGALAANTQLGVRRLTPTECERLQGFPDGWTAGQSDYQRYKQLGNAVTVNVIEWIGKRIMEVESYDLR